MQRESALVSRACLGLNSARRQGPTGKAWSEAGPALRKAAWAAGPPPPLAPWPSHAPRSRRTEFKPRHALTNKAARAYGRSKSKPRGGRSRSFFRALSRRLCSTGSLKKSPPFIAVTTKDLAFTFSELGKRTALEFPARKTFAVMVAMLLLCDHGDSLLRRTFVRWKSEASGSPFHGCRDPALGAVFKIPRCSAAPYG